jgi:hypothetical protein
VGRLASTGVAVGLGRAGGGGIRARGWWRLVEHMWGWCVEKGIRKRERE